MSRSGRVAGNLPWTGLRATGATGGDRQPPRPAITHRQHIAARRDTDALRTLLVERLEALRGGADHDRARPYPLGPYTPITDLPF